jgi:hypothetical protein
MTPGEARALAGDRRAELRRRAQRIRRSVAAVTAALSCTLFLVLYVQLASGHDPGLLASSKARSTSTVHKATSTSSEAATEAQSTEAESSGSEESGASEESGESSSSVRTSQS